MKTLLQDIIEHHVWANETLFRFCESLSPEQLELTAPGTYRNVGRTLVHLAEAEQAYLSRVPDSGVTLTFDDEQPVPAIAELTAGLRETGEAWRHAIRRWPSNTLLDVTWHGQNRTFPLSVFVAQAIDHGVEQRTHVRVILSAHGIETPEIDVWAWDEARQGNAGVEPGKAEQSR